MFVEDLIQSRVERMRGAPGQVIAWYPHRRLLRVPSSFAIAIGDSVVRGIDRVDLYFSVKARETHMTKPEISGIAPFFIVKNVPAALSFYRDRLGFDIAFQGPSDDDIFFGIVRRGAAMIMLKDVGVDPVPNYTRDIKKGIARWDAYLHVPDPDALAAEFSSRNVEFFQPLKDDDDGLRGFEVKDADGYLLFFGHPRS
jgi:catechol 2,3-dioxygenase-like lactoylglutathione lyase family enzyme